MNKNWDIILTKGLGQIEFGFSRDQITSYAEVYGEVNVLHDENTRAENNVPEDEFRAFLARNGMTDAFSEEEISTSAKLSKTLDDIDSNIVEERRLKDHILALEYKDGALYSLTTDGLNTEIHHGGKLIFATDAKEILEYFLRLNGDAKVYQDDVIFDKIGILLSGFYHQNPTGSWRFYQEETDGEYHERFITLFAPSELNRYLTDEFTDVDFLNK